MAPATIPTLFPGDIRHHAQKGFLRSDLDTLSFLFFLERGRLAGMKARRPSCLAWLELHDRRAKLRLAEVDFRKRAPDHDFGDVLDVGRQNDFLLVVAADERFGLEFVE
jgi:hypothetical protein